MRDIPQNIRLAVFKIVKVVKNNTETVTDGGDQGDRTIELNVISWTGSWNRQNLSGKTREIQVKSSFINNTALM